MQLIIIEGADSCGKSTLATSLSESIPNSIITRHPGATAEGSKIRSLVKDKDNKFTSKSAQLLMCIDQLEFVDKILLPNITNDVTIIADRISYISGIIYGLAEGMSISDIKKIMSLYDTPKPTKVFILTTTWEIIEKRRQLRNESIDRFEGHGIEFNKKVLNLYNSILYNKSIRKLISKFISLESIEFIDASMSKEELHSLVLKEIVND